MPPNAYAAQRSGARPPSRDADAPAAHGAVGKRTLVDTIGFASDAAVQRLAVRAPAGEPDAVKAAAEHGTSGGAEALPHLDRIQRLFGRHDVRGVRAHVGGSAAEGAAAMGAQAFATGDHVAFAGAPDLHTAAHEAAHVVQQRSGVHLKGGVGEVGDPYEQHADAVADRVVRGESAEALLDVHAPATPERGAAAGAAVQRFTVRGTELHLRVEDLSPQEVSAYYGMLLVDMLVLDDPGEEDQLTQRFIDQICGADEPVGMGVTPSKKSPSLGTAKPMPMPMLGMSTPTSNPMSQPMPMAVPMVGTSKPMPMPMPMLGTPNAMSNLMPHPMLGTPKPMSSLMLGTPNAMSNLMPVPLLGTPNAMSNPMSHPMPMPPQQVVPSSGLGSGVQDPVIQAIGKRYSQVWTRGKLEHSQANAAEHFARHANTGGTTHVSCDSYVTAAYQFVHGGARDKFAQSKNTNTIYVTYDRSARTGVMAVVSADGLIASYYDLNDVAARAHQYNSAAHQLSVLSGLPQSDWEPPTHDVGATSSQPSVQQPNMKTWLKDNLIDTRNYAITQIAKAVAEGNRAHAERILEYWNATNPKKLINRAETALA
jgi:hypothetical protein